MNKFTRIISKLSELKEYGMNRDRLSKEERAYILLTTNVTMFQGVVNEYGSESEFARAYGIPNLIYSINNDLVRIYIPKESFSVDLRQLMKDLDANVVEYYGIVQFDGTEPEARGEYIFDPVIQMSDKVITDFKGDSSDNSKGNDSQEDNSSDKDDSENKNEEKPKRKLYKLVKKSDKTSEDDKQDNEEELEDSDSEEQDEESDDDSSENSEEEDNDESNLDDLEDEGEGSSENESEEEEDDSESDNEESGEDNSEDEEDLDSDEENTFDKNSRAYFMKGIKDPNDEDKEGVSDEDNSEDEEDPDSVDQFFDDEEVETNLDKKSDEIEKDLSRELDKRIEDEKAKKKEAKDKSKKFTKLKKKEKVKKESIEVSSIPSSRVANMDLLKSLASEPIEYSNSGFNDFDRIEKIIKKSMLSKDDYKKRKRKIKLVY